MENIGCEIIVNGHVQGVGFRYYTSREASKYNLTGHAKNLSCGDVEVLLFGKKGNIDKMLKWLEQGPKTARVDNISASYINYSKHHYFLCY
ncbi:acylphosphatase [Psychromonas antarctica]|jgi:acylphosphatase|uniref:acylphosphatase n=1 Tax=Psychromonas antarctica TaxID=67573 RepID=UPI001EE7B928|nr:acylphosphatase [Psychromonas antarctica]MCG6201244.1 acylphosphatase [Psychromonas antarctica]